MNNNIATIPTSSVNLVFRTLTEDDAETLKQLRLRALREDGRYFLANYNEESAWTLEQWKEFSIETEDKAFFGAFDNDVLVGLYRVKKLNKPPFGDVAYWRSEYTAPEFRNKSIASRLYPLRLEWSRNHGFKEAVFVIGEANTLNKAIHIRRGAQIFRTESLLFADNKMHAACWYVKQLFES